MFLAEDVSSLLFRVDHVLLDYFQGVLRVCFLVLDKEYLAEIAEPNWFDYIEIVKVESWCYLF